MKKTLLIVILLGIFLILIAIPLTLRSSRQLLIPQFPPIPTPVVVHQQFNNPSIHVSLTDGAVLVSFSSSLSASLQAQTTISSTPALTFTTSWIDSQTLAVEPTSTVDSKQTYSLKVISPLGTVVWNVAGEQLLATTTQQNISQAQADKSYADHQAQIVSQYPWITNFPLLTTQYFVYFDTQQKQFVAKLYTTTASSTPEDQQVASLKQQVLAQIASFGIDTNQYPISWITVPNGGQ